MQTCLLDGKTAAAEVLDMLAYQGVITRQEAVKAFKEQEQKYGNGVHWCKTLQAERDKRVGYTSILVDIKRETAEIAGRDAGRGILAEVMMVSGLVILILCAVFMFHFWPRSSPK